MTIREKAFSLFVAVCVASISLAGQELVTLTTPEAKPSNTNYHVERVHLDVDAGILSVYLRGLTGEEVGCHWTPTTTPTGATLITGLNKANLASAYAANATTGSLKQRIFHRLVVMAEAAQVCGKSLAGTLAGTVP